MSLTIAPSINCLRSAPAEPKKNEIVEKNIENQKNILNKPDINEAKNVEISKFLSKNSSDEFSNHYQKRKKEPEKTAKPENFKPSKNLSNKKNNYNKTSDKKIAAYSPLNSKQIEGDLFTKGAVVDQGDEKGLNPKYPLISRRNGEEGTVKIQATIDKFGKPQKIRIIESSGFTRLDKSAMEAVQSAKFIPARKGGVNVDSDLGLNIKFELKDI